MSIRNLVHIPDPILRTKSKAVERFDDALQKLVDDMLETMYDAPGVGLAAIQIAVPLQILAVDVAEREIRKELRESGGIPVDHEVTKEPIIMINPKILKYSDDTAVEEEGCLSIPDYFAEVERPADCKVEFLDRNGRKQTVDADGILSTVIQHEVDHLNGKLFIDYLSSLKRNMVIRKFTKYSKQNKIPPATAVYA